MIEGYEGLQVRDNIDAYDVSTVIEEFRKNPGSSEVYNIGGGRDNSISIIEAIEKINQEKANLLYDEIDNNPVFIGTANKEDRSNMNVCFLLTDNNKEELFNKLCDNAGINGIKGHRSVGGYRASIYNAMPIESVQTLVDVMQKLK